LRWWWLQAIIPLLTFLLYVVCLAYTLHVDQERALFRELGLMEIVSACTDARPAGIAVDGALGASDPVGGRKVYLNLDLEAESEKGDAEYEAISGS
jgi:hypothetical protein